MKNCLFILLFISLLTASVFAEKKIKLKTVDTSPMAEDLTKVPLAAFLADSAWHIINYKGEELFSSTGIFEILGYKDGFIRARINDKGKSIYAFLNMKGEIVIKPECIFAFDFSEGMALSVRLNQFAQSMQIFGYYDSTGKEVIPHIWDDATEFSEGLAFVKNADSSGYIDKTGKIVIPMDSIAGNPFHEGLADVNNADYKIGFMDHSGKMIIKYKFDEVKPFSEGRATVNVYGKFGYIDKAGKLSIKALFDFANPFQEGRAFVAISEDTAFIPHWGFIDTIGKVIADFKYADVIDFSEGLAAVKKDKKWGFIDRDNKIILPFEFNFVRGFKNGFAWASKKDENIYGFINKKGEYIIKLSNASKVVDLRWNYKVK